MLLNKDPQLVAMLFGYLLGIIEKGMLKMRWQYDSRREDRSRQAAAARFIAAGFDQFFL